MTTASAVRHAVSPAPALALWARLVAVVVLRTLRTLRTLRWLLCDLVEDARRLVRTAARPDATPLPLRLDRLRVDVGAAAPASDTEASGGRSAAIL